MPSRRDVLRTLAGTAVLAGTAGCLGSGTDDPILACVSATNEDGDTHSVHLTVEYGGERAAWETLELPAHEDDDTSPERVWLPRSWSAEPGEFVVRARVDDRDHWETLAGDRRQSGRSLHVSLDVQPNGDAEFWVLALPAPDDQCAGAPVATDTSGTPD